MEAEARARRSARAVPRAAHEPARS
jgi:hypothetical protein